MHSGMPVEIVDRSRSRAASAAAARANEPRHWVAVRQRGTLLAASTLRCQGDYRSAAAATVLAAGQLTSRAEPPPAGVLVPGEVLTISEMRPGLAEVGITVIEEPTADHNGPRLATQNRTGNASYRAGKRGAPPVQGPSATPNL